MYCGFAQSLAAVSLIFWSLLPVYYPEVAQRVELSLYVVMASIVVLVLGFHQQSADYIDMANSLEDSARKIDGLRREIQSSILAGCDLDPKEYFKLSGEYTKILSENPSNHASCDHEGASNASWFRCIPKGVRVHLRASLYFIATVVVVVIFPAVLTLMGGC
jgi:hypothetical protein